MYPLSHINRDTPYYHSARANQKPALQRRNKEDFPKKYNNVPFPKRYSSIHKQINNDLLRNYEKYLKGLEQNEQIEDEVNKDYKALYFNGSSENSSVIPKMPENTNFSQLPIAKTPESQHLNTNNGDLEQDCSDDFSWLLNYKIHQEIPPVPDTAPEPALSCNKSDSSAIPIHNPGINNSQFPEIERSGQHLISSDPEPNHIESIQNHNLQQEPPSGPKKPPFTYTELIEHALGENGELTVSGIYQWISDHFPFYKRNDDRWKNSVRHNLSINPHFRKGGKATQGAGHLWTIAQRDDRKAWQIKQRMNHFIQNNYKEQQVQVTEQEVFDRELRAATESIMGEISYKKDDAESNQIEIEYINLYNGANGLEGFLTPPVSKQDIVNECGLGSDYFITDINPNSLDVNLHESEVVSDDRMYPEVLTYYEMKD